MKPPVAIGNTPLISINGLFVKLECANPSGSIKDRIALFMLKEAERAGRLRPGDVIVEATSGNTGIALALVGRELGHPVLIFMPEHMSEERRLIMERLGATVELTPKAESFEGAIARRNSYRGRPGHFVPDQFGNPDNARCHQETTGIEIIEQLREHGCEVVDYLVAGVGTGGTLMGTGRALKAAMPGVRIVAVEPEESAVMSGCSPGDHGIMGIGDGFVPDLVDMKEVDDVIRVSTADAHAAAAEIRSRHGYCVGRSAGANTVAAMWLRERGAAVITFWPDCSNRYVSLGLEAPGSAGCSWRARCKANETTLFGDD